MRPAAAGLAGGALVLLAVTMPADAFTVRRVAGSLKDRPTEFTPAVGAPQTEFRRQAADSRFERREAGSSFGLAAGPQSVFRASEVAPSRVEVTRALLGELQARRTESQAIVVDLPADVLFDFDRADLRADAQASLDKAIELLASYPDAAVAVHGHTDGKGSDGYNERLSLRRAQIVAERLAGPSGRRFEVRGFGRRRPIAPNAQPDGSDDPEGRQRNRRVEIVIRPAVGAKS